MTENVCFFGGVDRGLIDTGFHVVHAGLEVVVLRRMTLNCRQLTMLGLQACVTTPTSKLPSFLRLMSTLPFQKTYISSISSGLGGTGEIWECS